MNTTTPTGPPPGAPGGQHGGCDGVYQIQPGAPVPDQGPQTAASVWVLLALATIFLALRIYSKFRKSRGLWWDDWILIASWVSLKTLETFFTPFQV